MRLTAAFCLLIASAIPAAAVPATPEGAARIEAAFRQVLGPLPGIVTVTPGGATYAATVDLSPLVALIPEPDFKATITPYTLTLTDNGDGTWGVAEDQDFALTIDAPGAFQMSYTIDAIRSEGVFDTALMALTSYRAETGPIAITSRATGPDGVALNAGSSTADGMVMEATGKAGAAGGVDVDSRMTMTNYRQTMALPVAGPDAPPTDISMTMATYGYQTRFEGFRSAEILALIGFFVDRPAPERIVADQEVLRAALTAALPLFGRIEGTFAGDKLAVQTPVGPVTADQVAFSLGLNGIVKEGHVSEGITIKGLSLPPGLMPAWAEALLPQDTEVGVELTGFSLADPAGMVIQNFDLTRPEPIATEMQFGLLGALLPTGMVEIRITPSSLGSDLYGIEASGQFTAGMMVPPSGKVQVTATGLDAVEATLDPASDDPDAAGLRGALGIARALATPGANGALAWEIEFTEAQRVLVNGTDVTGAP